MRKLSDLEVGESGVLVALDLPPGVQNHLMYMGFVPDAQVKVLHRAPVGDPTVYSIDGFEVANWLRNQPRTLSAVLVAVSGWHGDRLEKRVQTAGFAHYFLKPANLDELQDLLSRVASSPHGPSPPYHTWATEEALLLK